eukprot:1146088-Pelagomonas_calceolata.AAC.3
MTCKEQNLKAALGLEHRMKDVGGIKTKLFQASAALAMDARSAPKKSITKLVRPCFIACFLDKISFLSRGPPGMLSSRCIPYKPGSQS